MKKIILVLIFLSLAVSACAGTAPQTTVTPDSIPPAESPASALPTAVSSPRSDVDRPRPGGQPRQGTARPIIAPSLADVTYCTMDGVELKMDFYYPETATQPLPVAMYVHGGGWRKGDKERGAGGAELPALQQAGFLAVAVNYRLAPEYELPAMIEDVKCAVRFLRAHADEYNLDPNRIGVFGGSAGGHLVSMLGTTDESAGFDVGEYLEYSSRVQAVVDMFGPVDLTDIVADDSETVQSALGDFDSALASPVTYVTPDDPPFLIIHGDADKLVPLEQSQSLLAALQAVGVPAELVVVTNAGHGLKPFQGLPISPSHVEIMELIVAFFEAQLQ
ncbi:MAG: Acetyl esterase [Anaerolineales bacterium]|nr:Acetyl esterase [Anaerolineales bacterium]